MDGVPSIRVHHALDYANSNHIIRWTEVFILKVSESNWSQCKNVKTYLTIIFFLLSERLISRMMNRRMERIQSICQNCRNK